MTSPAARAPGAVRDSGAHSERWLGLVLWVLQGSLAAVFGIAGWTKIAKSDAALQSVLNWSIDVPVPLMRIIGVCELLGAIGLLLPAATRVRPELTPAAATGLTTIMALAISFHLYRGDAGVRLMFPTALALVAAFVAWARFRKAPIVPR
jgi:uncharacterized membrane protein YphA (DoxX/SURF4 family)